MNMGGRAYPVRHYPIAIRLRDREGRAILCIALSPQSGDSSGAILGVRSVALLHLIIDTFLSNTYRKRSAARTSASSFKIRRVAIIRRTTFTAGIAAHKVIYQSASSNVIP